VEIVSKDLRTLQLGPLWVLSALAGTASRFRPYELDAFWDTVVSVTLRTPPSARDVLISMAKDRAGLLLEFELQDEPVVSGLRHVVAALDRGPTELAEDYKLAVFRIGLGVGRSRGPYGRTITPEDEQLLLLIAELLELDVVPPIIDVLV
jgi:hypothetical protein